MCLCYIHEPCTSIRVILSEWIFCYGYFHGHCMDTSTRTLGTLRLSSNASAGLATISHHETSHVPGASLRSDRRQASTLELENEIGINSNRGSKTEGTSVNYRRVCEHDRVFKTFSVCNVIGDVTYYPFPPPDRLLHRHLNDESAQPPTTATPATLQHSPHTLLCRVEEDSFFVLSFLTCVDAGEVRARVECGECGAGAECGAVKCGRGADGPRTVLPVMRRPPRRV